jgi:hypothetical protein
MQVAAVDGRGLQGAAHSGEHSLDVPASRARIIGHRALREEHSSNTERLFEKMTCAALEGHLVPLILHDMLAHSGCRPSDDAAPGCATACAD